MSPLQTLYLSLLLLDWSSLQRFVGDPGSAAAAAILGRLAPAWSCSDIDTKLKSVQLKRSHELFCERLKPWCQKRFLLAYGCILHPRALRNGKFSNRCLCTIHRSSRDMISRTRCCWLDAFATLTVILAPAFGAARLGPAPGPAPQQAPTPTFDLSTTCVSVFHGPNPHRRTRRWITCRAQLSNDAPPCAREGGSFSVSSSNLVWMDYQKCRRCKLQDNCII